MYNLYLKGLSTDNDELNKIRKLFKKYGLDITIIFDKYSDLPLKTDGALKVAIDDKIRKCNPKGQKVNLICHSMGCNLGVIATERSKKIKTLVLISPEFGEYSDKELAQIRNEEINLNNPREFGEEGLKNNGQKVRSLIIFKKTKPMAKIAIEKIQIPTLIIYSKDDSFIPKDYLKDLADRKENIKIATINTKFHNPLVNGRNKSKTIHLIQKHIKKSVTPLFFLCKE